MTLTLHCSSNLDGYSFEPWRLYVNMAMKKWQPIKKQLRNLETQKKESQNYSS